MDVPAKRLDPLAYFVERLRERPRRKKHWFQLRKPAPPVRRIFTMQLGNGCTEVIPEVDATVVIRCAQGTLWITHDHDVKDVTLTPGQVYRAARPEAMRLHAVDSTVVMEIQFDDDADGELIPAAAH